MRSIFKYQLNFVALPQRLDLPDGARVLTVAAQADRVTLWAEVDVDHPPRERRFRTYGTGHPLPPEPGQYLGTAHLVNQGLVVHVYEETR